MSYQVTITFKNKRAADDAWDCMMALDEDSLLRGICPQLGEDSRELEAAAFMRYVTPIIDALTDEESDNGPR
jgi:hypothetical protein